MYISHIQHHIHTFCEQHGHIISTNIEPSKHGDFDYQTNLFLKHKIIPREDLVAYLQNTGDFEQVAITGPGFLCMKVRLQDIENNVKRTPQTVLVDYCGVNVAKKMHIGHIRSMFLGDAIARYHIALGDTVIKNNHVGDWGNQFGYLLAYVKDHPEALKDVAILTNAYKDAYHRYQHEPSFAEVSERTAMALHAGDDDTVKLWQHCVDVSMKDTYTMMEYLNIDMGPEHTFGESFYRGMIPLMMDELLSKDIAQQDPDGSIVVKFDDKPPVMLQKSNGSPLYAAFDLAAIKHRITTYNPHRMVYVTDKRQELHFEQVFAIARHAGWVPENVELIHVGFGTILGADKKPLKTRSGTTPYLDDLLQEGREAIEAMDYIQKMERGTYRDGVVHNTLVGSFKFFDMKSERKNDYAFDWNHVLNVSGGSAPYIHHALTRIDSLFVKGGIDIFEPRAREHTWHNDTERSIILGCQQYPEVFASVTDHYSFHHVMTHTLKLAQQIQHYYEQEAILGHEHENHKLNVLHYAYHTLREVLNIVGIDVHRSLHASYLGLTHASA